MLTKKYYFEENQFNYVHGIISIVRCSRSLVGLGAFLLLCPFSKRYYSAKTYHYTQLPNSWSLSVYAGKNWPRA